MVKSMKPLRIVAAGVIAGIAGTAAASIALADDRHDRDFHHDRVRHDSHWHGHGVVVASPPAYYVAPPVVYAPPPPPPVIGLGLDFRIR